MRSLRTLPGKLIDRLFGRSQINPHVLPIHLDGRNLIALLKQSHNISKPGIESGQTGFCLFYKTKFSEEKIDFVFQAPQAVENVCFGTHKESVLLKSSVVRQQPGEMSVYSGMVA